MEWHTVVAAVLLVLWEWHVAATFRQSPADVSIEPGEIISLPPGVRLVPYPQAIFRL